MLSRAPGRAAATFVVFTAALAAVVAAAALSTQVLSQGRRVTPISDPTQLPRLTFDQLKYAGAFRLPAERVNNDSFTSGGGPLAFNPARNSLFVGARSGRVAEITIPTPVTSAEVAALPFAEYLQAFEDPSDGGIKEIAKDGAMLAGLLVYRNRLYGTGSIYYDAANAQRRSHFARPLTLIERGATPLRAVWDDRRTGYVAGYLALVPPEWQTRLGGPAVTGQCCVPIVSRTSMGPAAFAFDPAAIDDDRTVDARPLVYYPGDHPTLGSWSGSGPVYGATTEVAGLALIAGTRTAVFVGRNGTGPYCYGDGTGDRALDQTTDDKGVKRCYDPTNPYKGPHAYPYRYQMWAYDLGEWAEVRAGRRDPWSVKPYAVWPFELPTPELTVRLLGVAYDAATQRLFVSQLGADRGRYESRAVIHVYQLP